MKKSLFFITALIVAFYAGRAMACSKNNGLHDNTNNIQATVADALNDGGTVHTPIIGSKKVVH